MPTTQGPSAQTGGIHDLISERIGLVMRARSADVGHRILRGDNRIVVDDEFMGRVMGRTVYEVPRWQRQPIKRLRVTWARWCYRRSNRRENA